MKRLFSMLLLCAVFSMAGVISAGTPVNPSDLPKAAQTFLSKHFAGDNVKKVEKEQGRRGMEYDVNLQSGAEVDFTENGEWKDVKAPKKGSVPSAIVPSAISKHVTTNYSGQSIVEISRKRGGYEVELSNGTELYLTEDGTPMQPRQGGRGNRH